MSHLHYLHLSYHVNTQSVSNTSTHTTLHPHSDVLEVMVMVCTHLTPVSVYLGHKIQSVTLRERERERREREDYLISPHSSIDPTRPIGDGGRGGSI